MVGVPGRSKGCNTCRKRKIRCDGAKPECGQCVKTQRTCAGYAREMIFCNSSESPGTGALAGTLQLASYVPKPKELDPPPASPLQNRKKSSSSSSSSRSPRAARTALARITKSPPRTRTFSPPSVDDENTYSSNLKLPQSPTPAISNRLHFLSQFIGPDRFCISRCKSRRAHKPWISVYPRLLGQSEAADQSMLAVCTMLLGRVKQDPVLVRESMRIYGVALNEMAGNIMRGKTADAETLAASMALGLYESINHTNEAGWRAHTGGTGRLMCMMGPEVFKNGIGHRLFTGYRVIGILEALKERKGTFLGQEKWCAVPWEGEEMKSMADYLHDHLAHIAALLEQSDLLARSTEECELSRALHLAVYERAWELHDRLMGWEKEYIDSFPTPPFWSEPSLFAAESDAVFTTALSFASPAAAHDLLCLYAPLVLLFSILTREHATLTQLHDVPASSLRSPLGALYYARHVCESMEFFMKRDKKVFGPAIAFWSLRVAAEAFEAAGMEREMAWCAWAVEKLSGRCLTVGEEVERVGAWREPREQAYHTVGICFGGWL